jgi:hypothetical protein
MLCMSHKEGLRLRAQPLFLPDSVGGTTTLQQFVGAADLLVAFTDRPVPRWRRINAGCSITWGADREPSWA